jgi:hypothetical protein
MSLYAAAQMAWNSLQILTLFEHQHKGTFPRMEKVPLRKDHFIDKDSRVWLLAYSICVPLHAQTM